MTTEEANKIIAEYIGWNDSGDYHVARKIKPFSNSLDNLVLVWEKLGFAVLPFINSSTTDYKRRLCKIHFVKDVPIQEAAAIATAKAIQEISN